MRLPGKIKHFFWKVLRGALSCYGILDNRHIPCCHQCLVSSVGMEDIQHCLLTCRRAQEVWRGMGLRDTIRQAVMQDRSGSVTMEILSNKEPVAGEAPLPVLIIVARWYIWWQRRQIVKGELITQPDRTTLSIKAIAAHFVRASTSKGTYRNIDQMWKRSCLGTVKINVNASFFPDTLDGATGAMACDEEGQFVVAASWVLPAELSHEAWSLLGC